MSVAFPRSLPSRERGLKLHVPFLFTGVCVVAPFTGAWIEMQTIFGRTRPTHPSLPSRERGLKSAGMIGIIAQSPGRSLHGSVD